MTDWTIRLTPATWASPAGLAKRHSAVRVSARGDGRPRPWKPAAGDDPAFRGFV